MNKVSRIFTLIAVFQLFVFAHSRSADKQDFYQLKIYQLKTKDQESRLDKYLQFALIPALHRMGISKVGVFKPVGNDTAAIRQVYVLLSFSTMNQFMTIDKSLAGDKAYQANGKDYLEAVYSDPVYLRMESILLQAFPEAMHIEVPALQSPHSERIYELRSYEGATEKIHANKVDMFNKGDEVGLFKRLGFNAVFYAEVISGAHMPNLMYMTSFENMQSHDEHWKAFVDDAYWKKLSAMPEYQHNVSSITITLLHSTDYSDL